jgi:hypothetical protein
MLLTGGALAAYGAAPASPFTECPGVGQNPHGCAILIVVTSVNSAGAATGFTAYQSTTDIGPFDGSEDTLVGILNSSGSTLKSVAISGGAGSGIFGFDGDGACSQGLYTPAPTAAQCPGGAYTSSDPGDYESSSATFTAIAASTDAGTVLVGGASGLASSGTAWFDLENAIGATSIVPTTPPPTTPAPPALLLLLTGLAGLGAWQLSRRFAGRAV